MFVVIASQILRILRNFMWIISHSFNISFYLESRAEVLIWIQSQISKLKSLAFKCNEKKGILLPFKTLKLNSMSIRENDFNLFFL
jgi:hypothetical protein